MLPKHELCVMLSDVPATWRRTGLTAVGLSETPPKYRHTHIEMRIAVISWTILRFIRHVSREYC